MKRKLTRIFVMFLLLTFGVAGMSCNSAPQGFNAPDGSTVTLPADSTLKTSLDFRYVFVDISVTVPVGITPIFPSDNAPATTTGPGNDIFVSSTCTDCVIFYWPTSDGRSTLDVSKLQEAVNGVLNFVTDSRGLYTVALLIPAPATLGVTSYTATFSASIGTMTAQMNIDVSKPST